MLAAAQVDWLSDWLIDWLSKNTEKKYTTVFNIDNNNKKILSKSPY